MNILKIFYKFTKRISINNSKNEEYVKNASHIIKIIIFWEIIDSKRITRYYLIKIEFTGSVSHGGQCTIKVLP